MFLKAIWNLAWLIIMLVCVASDMLDFMKWLNGDSKGEMGYQACSIAENIPAKLPFQFDSVFHRIAGLAGII